jgi:hypothetical protein
MAGARKLCWLPALLLVAGSLASRAMRRVSTVLIAALLSLAPVANSATLRAQSTGAAPAPSIRPPSEAQIVAARELLRIMDVERTTMGGIDVMLNAQFGANPALTPYLEVVKAWARKYMAWQVIGERIALIYADAFTEAELRELITFYQTPTGRKVVQATPELMRRASEVGAEVAAASRGELQSMMEARSAELAKQQGTPFAPPAPPE